MSAKSRRPWAESYPEDVPASVELKPYRNLNHMFTTVCRTYAARTAYISFGHAISYRTLATLTDNLASYLQSELKLKRGERVALILPNLIQYAVSVFAVLRAGLTVVNINPLYTPREMQHVLANSQAAAVIALDTCARGILEIRRQTALKHIIITGVGDLLGPFKGAAVNCYVRYLTHLVPAYDRSEVIPFKQALKVGRTLPFEQIDLGLDDIAFVQYTGGTTGKAKGALLSHGNLIANISQILAMYGMMLHEGEEVMLTPLPLYHIFATTINLLLALRIACKNILVLDPRRLDTLEKILSAHPDITVMTGVNTLYNGMLNHGIFERHRLHWLKLAVGGGASILTGVAERFHAATGRYILEGYGLTECSPVACVNPHTKKEFDGSIGIPLPDTLARIVDEQGEEIWDLNVPGELEFQGPQVMQGYLNDPEDERLVRDGPWLRTGDVAVWLPGGYLKIIDRLKDMILVSGFNVFPSEIEDVVSRNPRVAECACIGIPSDTTGETVKLFVVKQDPTLTKAQLLNECRKTLTGYKLPRVVEFVPRLPKTPVGKVMRRYLKQNRLAD